MTTVIIALPCLARLLLPPPWHQRVIASSPSPVASCPSPASPPHSRLASDRLPPSSALVLGGPKVGGCDSFIVSELACSKAVHAAHHIVFIPMRYQPPSFILQTSTHSILHPIVSVYYQPHIVAFFSRTFTISGPVHLLCITPPDFPFLPLPLPSCLCQRGY